MAQARIPTVKQLRYFVTLVDTGHFGKAAKLCFVSQAAFSVAIQALETQLGAQLIDRTHRKVTVTELGQEVATQARLCLRDLEGLAELVGHRGKPLTGPLKLGLIPTIAPFLLPRVLPPLRRQYPELQLFLYEDTTERVYGRLMAGELDAILIALPFELRSVELMELFKDPFLLACREGTRLVDPEHYRYNRLQADTVLLLEDDHCLREHALAACKIHSLAKVRAFSANSLFTLIEMVNADLGITFLPRMAKDSALLANTKVRTYPLSEKSFRTIGLAWRQGSARAEEFRLLGEEIRQHHERRATG